MGKKKRYRKKKSECKCDNKNTCLFHHEKKEDGEFDSVVVEKQPDAGNYYYCNIM